MILPTKNIREKTSPSFKAKLTVNAQDSFYKNFPIINNNEIAILQKAASKIGNKKDTITINVFEPQIITAKKSAFRVETVRGYKMIASIKTGHLEKNYDLSQQIKTTRPFGNTLNKLFSDGFEEKTPFIVLQKWLKTLDQPSQKMLFFIFSKLKGIKP